MTAAPETTSKFHIVLCIFSFPLERVSMYDLLSQVHPTLCTFVLTIRLRVVIHDKLDL